MKTSHDSVLATGVSRIHRSDSFEALTQAFLSVAPMLVDADAFGLYLLDGKLQARAIYAVRADRRFLAEYERLRMSDPCFLHLLQHRCFIHTRKIVAGHDWNGHPLLDLMSRWGLRYSIEAPLVASGRLAGTLNIARCDRGYFDHDSLAQAQFLCEEMACAFDHIVHIDGLKQDLARATARAADLTPHADGAEHDRDTQPDYVERAVACMRAHCAEPLTIAAIATASGISARTLIEGFRRHLGTSPKALLREFRFQKVRDALIAAIPGTTTVADIATACGFNELGRFAVEYRQRYDESPSATLHRAASPATPIGTTPAIYLMPDVGARPVPRAGTAAGSTA